MSGDQTGSRRAAFDGPHRELRGEIREGTPNVSSRIVTPCLAVLYDFPTRALEALDAPDEIPD